MRTSSPARKTSSSKPAAKKTAARKTAAKKAPAKKTAAPLPVRTKPWMTDAQGYATLAARIVGINTPNIQEWRQHRDDTVTRQLDDGSTLHYTLATRTLTWQAICPMGAVHEYRLTSPSVACAARVHADRCTKPHADLTHIPALTAAELAELGLVESRNIPKWVKCGEPEPEVTETLPVTLPAQPRVLADQLTRARTATADTQPIPVLPAEQPKEHPES